jgi:exodeoxyribonuclease-3
MRIVSWNVNGFRAVLKKRFGEQLSDLAADILCLQETKASREVMEDLLPSLEIPYEIRSFHSAERKGYSGVAIFSKRQPERIFVPDELESCTEPHEGRVLVHEYENFYVVNLYVPNSGDALRRLDLRQRIWDPRCAAFLEKLSRQKPIIVCGDFNVAHQEIDLARPDQNHENAGFTDAEREGFSHILKKGFLDTFRALYPDAREAYTWWSMRTAARERNIGWRIDYILISEGLRSSLRNAFILKDVAGSDHVPVGIDIDVC